MKAEDFIQTIKVGDDTQAKYVSIEDSLRAIEIAHNDAVKRWTMWCFNYRTPFEQTICQIWGGKLSGFGGRYYCEDNYFTQHLIEKWQSLESRGDARMLYFYCDIDSGLKKQLVDWVMENYGG